MSQPTEPTRPATPRGPGDPAPGRRVSDSRHTFPHDAPAPPPTSPPSAASSSGGTGSAPSEPGSHDQPAVRPPGGDAYGPDTREAGQPASAGPSDAGPASAGPTSAGPSAGSTGPATSRPPIVPQIGTSTSAEGRASAPTGGSNPYGPAGARYVSD